MGGWQLAVGDWRLVAVGGGWWWLAAVGGWGLVVDGGWLGLAVAGTWRLVAVGGWWLMVPKGGHSKKKSSPLNTPPGDITLLSSGPTCGLHHLCHLRGTQRGEEIKVASHLGGPNVCKMATEPLPSQGYIVWGGNKGGDYNSA